MGQTFGEQRVGLSFNPSNLDDVARCKKTFADAIDQLHVLQHSSGSMEQRKLCEKAIDEALIAQMLAVKAITWKD